MIETYIQESRFLILEYQYMTPSWAGECRDSLIVLKTRTSFYVVWVSTVFGAWVVRLIAPKQANHSFIIAFQ